MAVAPGDPRNDVFSQIFLKSLETSPHSRASRFRPLFSAEILSYPGVRSAAVLY